MKERALGASPEVEWPKLQHLSHTASDVARAAMESAKSLQRDDVLANIHILLGNVAGMLEAFPELRRYAPEVMAVSDEVARFVPRRQR